MLIGTVRPEEARALSAEEGYHPFHNEDGEEHGSFEVFWMEGCPAEDHGCDLRPGWYWWACFPGCMADGDPSGPFASSIQARADADPAWLELP